LIFLKHHADVTFLAGDAFPRLRGLQCRAPQLQRAEAAILAAVGIDSGVLFL
jgi:hypothetical protein